MTDTTSEQDDNTTGPDLSRRDFVAMSLAAGAGMAVAGPASAAVPVTEKDVDLTTPDGTCDAVFIHPTSGRHPGVIVWADAFGLRPALVEMGRRLAGEGYAVLVPNPYYRVAHGQVLDTATFDFQNQADRARLGPLMGSITAAGAAERDARAFIAFLDAQPEVDTAKKIGTQGYCMGGPLVMRTASVSDRIGAGASFHGGGLVTTGADSPHLLAPKIHARMYFGVAANDDERQPDAKDTLREAFAAAKVPAEIEVYRNAQHGWCMPDMPLQNGMPIYSRPDAERAWGKLLALYEAGLS